MKPRIGLDLDGPIVDLYPGLFEVLNQRFGSVPPPSEWRSYKLEQLDVPQPELQTFLTDVFSTWPAYENAILVMGAGEALRKLRLGGYTLEVVTSRPPALRKATRRWLAEKGLLVHHVAHVCPGQKAAYAAERGFEAFLEDNPAEAASLAQVTRSFLFHRSYNASSQLRGAIRIRDWQEFITHVNAQRMQV